MNTHTGSGAERQREKDRELDTKRARGQEGESKDYEILGTLRLMMVWYSLCQSWFLEFENNCLIEESRLQKITQPY